MAQALSAQALSAHALSAHALSAHAMSPLLEVENLATHFPVKGALWGGSASVVRAVDGVSFNLAQGEALGLVGESGSGKSTLARTLMRLHRPTAGAMRFAGTDLAAATEHELRPVRRDMQMIFQDTKSSLNPRLRVRDIIAEPLITHGLASGRDAVLALLHQVGLDDRHIDRFPHQLSGGQRQRVGIARALALSPKFIIADEPVSALDVSIQAQILNLMKRLQHDLGIAFLLIAHDISVVSYFCDRVAVMYLGRIVEIGPRRTVMRSPSHPYTQALVSAVPFPDPTIKRSRITLRGEIPSPLNPPSGCRFHTRCPVRIGPICDDEAPPTYATTAGGTADCHLLGPPVEGSVDPQKDGTLR